MRGSTPASGLGSPTTAFLLPQPAALFYLNLESLKLQNLRTANLLQSTLNAYRGFFEPFDEFDGIIKLILLEDLVETQETCFLLTGDYDFSSTA